MHGWQDSGGYGSQLEKRQRASEELNRNSSGGSKGPDKGALAFLGSDSLSSSWHCSLGSSPVYRIAP